MRMINVKKQLHVQRCTHTSRWRLPQKLCWNDIVKQPTACREGEAERDENNIK